MILRLRGNTHTPAVFSTWGVWVRPPPGPSQTWSAAESREVIHCPVSVVGGLFGSYTFSRALPEGEATERRPKGSSLVPRPAAAVRDMQVSSAPVSIRAWKRGISWRLAATPDKKSYLNAGACFGVPLSAMTEHGRTTLSPGLSP